MTNFWFTSDEHYGHENILWLGKGRSFSTVVEMNETLIERHNKLVKPGDCVYHLGDMFWGTVDVLSANSILSRLNGQHYLIFGNHRWVDEKIYHSRLIWKKEIYTFKNLGTNIVLCHYPIAQWQNKEKGWWHLYGHVHGNFQNEGLSFDAGVDKWNFAPINLDMVRQHMSTLPMPASKTGSWNGGL